MYSASGVKLQKKVDLYDLGGAYVSSTITNYSNGAEYDGSNNLVRLQHTEGAIVKNSSGVFQYEYVLRDHLGNTRVTFGNANNDGVLTVNDIKQINHYYPFGLNMDGPGFGAGGANKYQFGGKELNSDFGLNWNHHDWRFLDVASGRFVTVDPLSDIEPSQTPYRYAFNNPLTFSDPDGLFETEEEAKKYAKDNGIKTGWFRSNKIVEQSDGTYAIENRKESTSVANDKDFGITKAALHIERGVHLADIGFQKAADLGDMFSFSYNPNAVLKNDWFDRVYYAGTLLQFATPSGKLATVSEGAQVAKIGLSNAELVQKSATLAERAVGGTGSTAGIAKHEYASALLDRYQRIYGNKGLETKVYFNNNATLGTGNRGFLDVLDRVNGVIYDYKFGSAIMKPEQFNLTLLN